MANDWLKDFCLALKNLALYSSQHPRGLEYVDRAYTSLRRLLADRREVTLVRTGGRLLLDQVILDRDRGLTQQLEEDLAVRGVDALVFHATITPEEHAGLLRALITRPEKISEKGGFGQALQDEGVASVKSTAEKVQRPREVAESSPGGDVSLIEFLVQFGRGPSAAQAAGAPAPQAPSVTSMLSRDPEAVARAIMEAARNRDPGSPPSTETLAEIVADTLERLAERAIEEHQRTREEVLADVGRAVVGADPRLHAALFLEKAGPRSTRKNLAAAVESLPPESLSELVAIHYPLAAGDYRRLTDLLTRTLTWKESRSQALASLETRTRAMGVGPEEHQDLVDHLLWNEVSTARRLQLLHKGDFLWRVDFNRLREVLVKLFASDQVHEATTIIQKYLGGLTMDDIEIRRLVADNARYILQLIEKTGKAQPILGRITELFFTRLQDEQDPDVVSRLAGGLAFLADLRLRTNDLGATLDLMRKAEALSASQVPALKERGERLAEALSRAGNDKIFKSLTEMLLAGGDQASMEAAEILKRGGNRSANYLIERLAEEESRTHRARLVTLLKEMGKGTCVPFLARLEDSRWFLVRNVVGILGDIGDPGVLPHLRKVASHGDPRVRREVVRTYTRFADNECEELIVEALADEDKGVQITAVNALATLKRASATGVLMEVARKAGPYQSIAPEVRQEAIASLGRLGAVQAFPLLSGILSRKGFLGHVEPTEIRAAAARALGGLGTPDAIALLKELAQKDPRQPVREAAQEGLAGLTPSAGAITPPR